MTFVAAFLASIPSTFLILNVYSIKLGIMLNS